MVELKGNPVSDLNRYELNSLAEHLEFSERVEDLHRLLALETSEQRNAWYEAREAASDSEGYLRDVQRAWRLAEGQFVAEHPWRAIALQCRYALIVTSLNSLSRSLSPSLAIELVAGGVWTPAQGLAYAARQAPDSAERPQVFQGLAPYLPASLLPAALALTQEVEYTYNQALRSVHTSLRLAELGNLEEALTEIQKIKNSDHRGRALAELASCLPESLLPTALNAAENINDVIDEARALRALVIRVAALGRPEQALAEAKKRASQTGLMDVLGKLAPHLPTPLREHAEREARYAYQSVSQADHPYYPTPENANREARAEALATLAVRLAQLGHVEQVLAEAQKVKHAANWAVAFAALAPILPVELLHQALILAQGNQENTYQWGTALSNLVVCLAEAGYPEQALAATSRISQPSHRYRALGALAPYLTGALLPQALALVQDDRDTSSEPTIRTSGDDHYRTEALEALESQSSGPPMTVARTSKNPATKFKVYAEPASCDPPAELRVRLAQAQRVEDTDDRITALAALAKHLSEPFVQACAAQVRTIRDTELRNQVVRGLTHRLTELGRAKIALALAQTIEDDRTRTTTLVELAPPLYETVGPQLALTIAKGLEDELDRAQLLLGLEPLLPGEMREHVLMEALVAARTIESEWQQAEVLAKLAPRLAASGQPKQALEMVKEIRDGAPTARALAALAPYLPEELLRTAMAMALRVGDWKRDAVPELASRLSPALLREFVSAALGSERVQDDLNLALLAPYLDENLVRTALAGLQGLWLPGNRGVTIFAELLVRLAELGYPEEALALFREFEEARFFVNWRGKDPRTRAEILTRVVPYLPENLRSQLLQEALEAAHQIPQTEYRVSALTALVPYLQEKLQVQVLQETLVAIEEIRSEHALVRLLPLLSESLLRNLLATVQQSAAWPYSLEALTRRIGDLPEGIRLEALQIALSALLSGHRPSVHTRLRLRGSTAYYLTHLAPHLTILPLDTFKALWHDALFSYVADTRQRLLSTLGDSGPVLAALGGEEAVAETFHAIQDVGRWWP